MAADRMTGFYPQSPASDPTVFLAGLVQLLSGYPSLILENLLSVHSGIPAKFKFLPTISEIREECERIVGPYRYAAEFERGNHELLGAPPAGKKPTLDELKAKHGPNWGFKTTAKAKNEFLSVGELSAKYGVSREAIDAIPSQEIQK